MLTRRDFIKLMSLVGAAVLNPFQHLGDRLGIESAVGLEEAVGELYAGFVLLPEGAPIPEFVRLPTYQDFDRCGMVEGSGVADQKPIIEYRTL